MALLQGSEDRLFPVDGSAFGAEGVEADFGRVLGEPRIGGCLQERVFEAFLNVFQVLFRVGGEPYLKGTFLDDDRSNRWFSRPSKNEFSTRGYGAVQMITRLVAHTV